MKTAVIIQARVGSTRLPRKVLIQLGGQTVLGRVIERLNYCRYVDQVVVATTLDPADDVIVSEGSRFNTTVVRGSEFDVLDRYYQAATQVGASEIVRITADCPLIDPKVIDQMIVRFHQPEPDGGALDYLSNVHPRTYPRGLDAEIFTIDALRIAHTEATERFEREHVTPFLFMHPERFSVANMEQTVDRSLLRWTLDEPADLLLLQSIFRNFSPQQFVSTEEVLALIDRNPELAQLNAHIEQKKLKAA